MIQNAPSKLKNMNKLTREFSSLSESGLGGHFPSI